MPFSILGAKVLRYFRSRERKFQGTKVPGSESTWERKFQLPDSSSLLHVDNTEWMSELLWVISLNYFGNFLTVCTVCRLLQLLVD